MHDSLKGQILSAELDADLHAATRLPGHGPDQAADAIESAESAELAGSMPLPPRRDVRERKLITAYGALDPRTDSSSNCHEKLCQSNIGCCPFW
ncbi:hypothetical protein WJX84_001266 [Apatococcus fuscideae]|uniref:Uncharacterized protein n=1 Tax=Apatococcus fuscideae TaxID=2026836 RepID=A0AAW1SME7_9CHLO